MSAAAIKILAVIAMLIDHAGYAFLPAGGLPYSAAHSIGGITAPVMCFFIAEGYYHTRDLRRYAARLAIFAAISHIPFSFFINYGSITLLPTSVIFTLLCALLALAAMDRAGGARGAVIALALAAVSAAGDWGVWVVLYTLAFGLVRGDRRGAISAFLALAALRCVGEAVSGGLIIPAALGPVFAAGLISLYNGARGRGGKWLFYLAYPAQFILFSLLRG